MRSPAGEGNGSRGDVEEVGDLAQAKTSGFPQESQEDIALGTRGAPDGSAPRVDFVSVDSQCLSKTLDEVVNRNVGREFSGEPSVVVRAVLAPATQAVDSRGAAQDEAVPDVLEEAVVLFAVSLDRFAEGVGLAVEEGKDVVATEPGEARPAVCQAAIAAPVIVDEAFGQLRPEGIAVDVEDQSLEVVVFFDDEALESALEEMSGAVVLRVEPGAVGHAEPVHRRGEIGARGAQEEVVVILHQDVGPDLDVEAVRERLEQLAESRVVALGPEDGTTFVASGEDVIEGVGALDALGSRHESKIIAPRAVARPKL